MKYAFFSTKKAAEAAVAKINDALGIPGKNYGFPGNVVTTYAEVEKIDKRWGFGVAEEGEGKADDLDAVKGKVEDYDPPPPPDPEE